jgi:hypothetical protein
MAKIAWCVANQAIIPDWVGKECEKKQCQWIVFMCQADIDDMLSRMGGA